MELTNITETFRVLGIEPTKEQRDIKNAYRERLAVTNPEDDPEGFKRLRAAFEAANRYAVSEDEELQEEKERDTSPSGLWVEKAAEIYSSIKKRCDSAQWEALFAEDIFFSLEEEENCRTKLLIFLMDHFRLPTGIWKLLDQKLHIVEGAGELSEHFQVEFVSYIANKCERGEDIEFESFSGDEYADYDLFLQYYDRTWRALETDDLKQVQELLDLADGLSITHPAMEICRARLLEMQGKSDEMLALLQDIQERYPGDSMVNYNAAEALWNHDKKEKAAQIFEHLKAEMDNHYMANVRLTEWYYNKGEFNTAKKCAEKVLPSGADDAFMELLAKVNDELEVNLKHRFYREDDWEAGLELCWCYLQDGKVH
ncbi:MAG: hypothetical protein IJ833_06810, partial [Lachnospiraceae bacterium]|nr:hypothetical protein [Lachnospiraceae bacterium]